MYSIIRRLNWPRIAVGVTLVTFWVVGFYMFLWAL